MKSFVTLIAALLLLPTQILAYWKGFSIGANTATGACKSEADWEADFAAIASWNKGFTAVRTFAASDCGTLANAVPAAMKYGFKILVGVWATDSTHFGNEKAALLAAIKSHGTSWIAAVSVGSEDLYRNDISASQLASQIYDVRGMVRQYSSSIKVGHTDTWTAWVAGSATPVIQACDMIIMDAYPYWQGAAIQNSKATFDQALSATRAAAHNVNPKLAIWVGETGYPSIGDSFGAAVPSRPNAQKYYKAVACAYWGKIDMFYFTAFDSPAASPKVEQGFGVAYYTRKLKISLDC